MWRLRWRYKLSVDRDVFRELSTIIGDTVRGYVGFIEGQILSRGIFGNILNRLQKKRAASGFADSNLWVDRILGSSLQAKHGKNNCASWCDPTTQWASWNWLYDLTYFH